MPEDLPQEPSEFESLGTPPEGATPEAPTLPDPPAAPGAPAVPPETQEPAVRPELAEMGFESEDDAIAQLRELREWRQSNEQYANYGRSIAPYASDVNQYIQTQRQQPEPQPESEPETPPWQKHESEYWSRPKYDPAWERMVEIGPNGRYVGVSPDVPPHIVQGVNEYKDWQRQKLEQIVDNPIGVFREGAQPWIEHVVQEQIQQAIQQQQYEQELQAVERELMEAVYEFDPTTGVPVIDPATNHFKLNEYGQLLVPHMQAARDMGITDPRQLKQYAENAVAAEIYRWQQQQAATAEEPENPSSVSSSTDAAGASPGAPAAPAQPAMPAVPQKTPQESFLEKSKRKAAHTPSMAGNLGNQEATPDAAGISVDRDDFFSAAAAMQGQTR